MPEHLPPSTNPAVGAGFFSRSVTLPPGGGDTLQPLGSVPAGPLPAGPIKVVPLWCPFQVHSQGNCNCRNTTDATSLPLLEPTFGAMGREGGSGDIGEGHMAIVVDDQGI